jgi:hypothetical protein
MTRYHLGDLLSITTGALVSPDHMQGVYRICDGVTGEQHFTHQLPRAARTLDPYLREQLPWLDEITAPKFSGPDEVWPWLAEMVARYGEYHEVQPMPSGVYVGRDPLEELAEMVGRERVIPIVVDGP